MSNHESEIVEVEGGHIIKSTSKKDRHSKVCTAKGPRDRRVRLSASTAIQFYDVQDRLGFDRPSKAVDWLIQNSKSSIDNLQKLPPFNPIYTHSASISKPRRSKSLISSSPVTGETEHRRSFVPASMDSDTVKSFFPVVSTELTPPQNQPYQRQDLRLSLQSLANETEQPTLFSSQSNFDWDQPSPELGRIQRLVTWNNDGGGFVFDSPGTTNTTSYESVYGQSQVFSQRGSLQSINTTPMIRAWFDQPYNVPSEIHQSAIPGIAFASNGEFAGFRIPGRFQDDNKPSSASSDSRN
ncbi:hypothetical protein AALP_AA4G027300 [Arabis alpina]|uniref:TCP domain-containing protein n=1 Tax=Arabis alpina TaxID=50452 RepID=A0A087H0R0_ARAAL|nr:hypothetical protein AALP_AA4G027300 [Arabis alpina]